MGYDKTGLREADGSDMTYSRWVTLKRVNLRAEAVIGVIFEHQIPAEQVILKRLAVLAYTSRPLKASALEVVGLVHSKKHLEYPTWLEFKRWHDAVAWE